MFPFFMKIGSTIYSLEAKVGTQKVPADLSHFEQALLAAGYRCLTPLVRLQTEPDARAQIEGSQHYASYVQREKDKVYFVVSRDDTPLVKLAQTYKPIPYKPTTPSIE